MFDVCWADPNRELRSEKAARKEAEAKRKDNNASSDSVRQSFSTTSSSSSEGRTQSLGLFSSLRARKSANSNRPRQSALQRDSLHDIAGARSSLSRVDTSELAVKPSETGSEIVIHSPDQSEAVSSSWSGSRLVSPHTSFAETATASTPPSSPVKLALSRFTPEAKADFERHEPVTVEHHIQSLGQGSFISRRTEVSISTRTMDAEIDELLSDIKISADSTEIKSLQNSHDSAESVVLVHDEPPRLAVQTTAAPVGSIMIRPLDEDTNNIEGSTLRSPQTEDLRWWKTSDNWDYSPIKEAETSDIDKFPGTPTSTDSDHVMAPDINALQREVRIMQAAGPDLMLANIKADMGDSSEAIVYKEFETSKKRWMYSSLYKFGGFTSIDRHGDLSKKVQEDEVPRVLALHESTASASYLAAMHADLNFVHLSTSPISPRLFPNVHPVSVSVVSAAASARGLSPQLYAAVTCVSLPSLFPTSEIPALLRQLSRCLIPGGSLHLTLIDPQPVSSSTGPKLRAWLFKHLLVHLERSFRTTLPSSAFPRWLAVARLRGKGSSITSVSVAAVPNSANQDGEERLPTVKEELRSLTVRMLWQEVWGRFVEADRWWWDDPAIVQECIDYGTKWEYSHVVAIKENR